MTPPVLGARASCLDLDRAAAPSATPSEEGPVACAYEAPSCSGAAPAAGIIDSLREKGLRFCREADSVVEGFLCDEAVVVSNACRKPANAFDAFVCDEPRMRSLQTRVLHETISFLKSLLVELLRR
jgi:hypothetical protein